METTEINSAAETTTKPLLPHKFNTISEILEDRYFIDFVRNNIDELKTNRFNRPAPEPGFRYKRDWYDRMEAEDNLSTDFFLNNIENIWLKKSSLSAQERSVVKYVCDKAFQQTLVAHSQTPL